MHLETLSRSDCFFSSKNVELSGVCVCARAPSSSGENNLVNSNLSKNRILVPLLLFRSAVYFSPATDVHNISPFGRKFVSFRSVFCLFVF